MTSTAGNFFPSHSCIGWPESSPHRDSNPGSQLERWMTYQQSYLFRISQNASISVQLKLQLPASICAVWKKLTPQSAYLMTLRASFKIFANRCLGEQANHVWVEHVNRQQCVWWRLKLIWIYLWSGTVFDSDRINLLILFDWSDKQKLGLIISKLFSS